ncbi:hypothetical protein [uncultured Sphingomonas sp.]|uniref:hypothetical protein n=1 Tax=uncultured Sphingomonas sp. TaxID=158754 RepID=UPI0035C94E49
MKHLGAILIGLGGCLAAHAQTRIENTATLVYQTAGGERVLPSNPVVLDVAPPKRATSLHFRALPPGMQLEGMACTTNPLKFTPAPIEAAQLAAAPLLGMLDVNQPLIMVLDAPGSNRDATAREYANIDVDAGPVHSTIALHETGVDTGVFAGGVPESGSHPELSDCDLTLQRGSGLRISFNEDPYSLASTFSTLIDPAGYVFDSVTAALIDGAIVSMVDAAGNPAQVFGDDGVSRYPSTVISGQTVTDASGRVYPGQRGRYRFPLAAPGTYFLKIVPPADYTAPSIVGPDGIAPLRDPRGRPFIINDASYGRALVLAGVDPFFSDIPLDRHPNTSLLLTKTASVRDASPGDFIQYRLQLTNRGTTAARDLHLFDTLPRGLRYESGSTRGAAEATVTSDGRDLDFVIPALDPGASAEVRYIVSVTPGAPAGEALNRVRLIGGASSSNDAAASVRLRPLLFTDALTVVGRVSQGDCGKPAARRKGVAGVRILLEDGTFVVTDRDGLYHFEGVRAGRHVVQLDTGTLAPGQQAVACDRDTRQADSAISRFVEGEGGVIKRVDFQLRDGPIVAAPRDDATLAVVDDATAAGNRDWLAGQTPGLDWVFPAADHNPRAPVLRVVIKHLPGQRVDLTVNGRATDALAFDGTDGDAGAPVAVSKWTGLPLLAGDNRLSARIVDADGTLVKTLERVVHYAGAPVHAVFDTAHSRLVADGVVRPLVAVRVTDAAGRPVRAGTPITFTVDQPYAAARADDADYARQPGATAGTGRVVGDDGYALLALQPTTQAGAVQLVVGLADDRQVRTTKIRTWLAAAAKEWVVVGFGAGTIGYDTLRRHSSALPVAQRGKVVTDGQLAVYAKGRVKGSWLLTIAYDSDRRYEADRGLLGTIDPDRYYTVYGDGTQQGYDAATYRKLYLRLERRDAFALFGDFETGFTDTQLARYSRTLNGLKAAYEGDHIRVGGFAAKTRTLYSRDEIQGNGLAGPYRLSARGIVPNSDKLRIEVRDRFRAERIVSSIALTRHIDYDIDTAAGTIRFREPVLTRDAALNPVFIVADYEVEGGRSEKLAAAARVVATAGRIELGASVIRDETSGAATLAAADLKARLGAATMLRAEVASGGRAGLRQGRAFLAEVEHHGGGIDVLAYARQQDTGYGLGQQNLVEAGTRKFGFDARAALTDRLSLTATGWYQDQLDGAGRRSAAEARLDYRTPGGTVFLGAQMVADRGLDGQDRDSRLFTIGGSKTLFGGALALTAQTQVAPGGDKASVDFPVRHQINAAWRVRDGIRLLGGYEIADGKDFVANTAQLGFDVAPWAGAKLMSTLNQQAIGENAARTYAQYGLSQSLPIGKHWTIDATLDASDTVRGAIAPGAVVNAFQPVASGGFIGRDQTNGDYAAATIGAAYREARWTWNGRLEYRDGKAQDRIGVTSNILRTLGEGRTVASGLRVYRIEDAAGRVASFAAADIALAWRPIDSNWSLLEHLEYRQERADTGFTDANPLGVATLAGGQRVTTRVINNLAVNYRTGDEGAPHRTEATVYHGSKYVEGRFADERFDGFIDVTGFDLRRDLGRSFDVGVAGSVQHAWDRGIWSWSGGPSVGASPAGNIWITAGYNIAGYRDRDFEADRYTRKGPYVTMRMKVDQRSIGNAARAVFGR